MNWLLWVGAKHGFARTGRMPALDRRKRSQDGVACRRTIDLNIMNAGI